MKRFLLFGFDDFYPSGGWNDFVGSFDSLEELKSDIIKRTQDYDSRDNWQVIDSETWTKVKL